MHDERKKEEEEQYKKIFQRTASTTNVLARSRIWTPVRFIAKSPANRTKNRRFKRVCASKTWWWYYKNKKEKRKKKQRQRKTKKKNKVPFIKTLSVTSYDGASPLPNSTDEPIATDKRL